MGLSTITVAGQPVTLVAMPAKPGLRSVEFRLIDKVAVSTSVFTGQEQAQKWPGADYLAATLSLPPLTQDQADEWISMLMACRGRANAIQVGDPLRKFPKGNLTGSLPLVDGSDSTKNKAGAEQIYLKGFRANTARVITPGDYFQVGYRLYRNLFPVNADGTGKAVATIWPSLREQPGDGAAVSFNDPRGLFRLATNERMWSADFKRLTAMSFQVVEYR